MINIKSIVNDLKLIKNSKDYLIEHNNSFYRISSLFYDILIEIKSNNLYEDHIKIKYNLNEDDYKKLIDSIISKINTIIDQPRKKSYILLKRQIISQQKVEYISNKLTFLFNKNLFNFYFITLCIINLLFSIYLYSNIYNYYSSLDDNKIYLIPIYTLSIVTLLIHELGHSTASNFFKIKPKEIGFGFYIIFPVFYSNVTEIWSLDTKKRLIVNIAGIYFQLIINSLLICFFIFSTNNLLDFIILSIIKINFFVILYSSIPFIRNDGYWFLSDFLNRPQLNKDANIYFIKLFLRKEKFNIFMFLYSFLLYSFLFFLIKNAFISTINNTSNFITILNKYDFIYIINNKYISILKLLFSLLITCVAFITIFNFIQQILYTKNLWKIERM